MKEYKDNFEYIDFKFNTDEVLSFINNAIHDILLKYPNYVIDYIGVNPSAYGSLRKETGFDNMGVGYPSVENNKGTSWELGQLFGCRLILFAKMECSCRIVIRDMYVAPLPIEDEIKDKGEVLEIFN